MATFQFNNFAHFNSVYVKNVRDNFTQGDLEEAFSKIGEVERIDIVNYKRENGSLGRNVFVHFKYWHDDQETIDTRVSLYHQKFTKDTGGDATKGVRFMWYGHCFYLFINEKPIVAEPLNNSQLSENHRIMDGILREQAVKIASLEFELSEIRRLLSGKGTRTRSPSSELEKELETEA
jgi:RNA recognition motif-containing protein